MMLDTAVRLSAPPREWGGRMPETGGTYYDRQEVRDPEERESSIFNALPGLIRHALDNAPYFAETLAGIEPDNVASRADLARLPIIRKSDLSELQSRQRPFGRITATPIARLARIFASPGPIYDPEGARTDYWRLARAMYAAGFRPGDVVHNSFSYHLTPAGCDGGKRRQGPGPAGDPWRDRGDRIAAPGHRRHPSDRLCGDAVVSADAARAWAAAGSGHVVAQEGAGIGRAVPGFPPDHAVRAVRHPCRAMLCHGRSRLDRLREPDVAWVWSWTRRSSSRSFARARPIRSPPARSARSWSPPSIPTIR